MLAVLLLSSPTYSTVANPMFQILYAALGAALLVLVEVLQRGNRDDVCSGSSSTIIELCWHLQMHEHLYRILRTTSTRTVTLLEEMSHY